jgi:hypothetical protein
VKEKRIELLRQGRVLPSTDLVGCRPASGERVPTPQPGETVVFYDHFPRGFALPPRTSCGSSWITSICSRTT